VCVRVCVCWCVCVCGKGGGGSECDSILKKIYSYHVYARNGTMEWDGSRVAAVSSGCLLLCSHKIIFFCNTHFQAIPSGVGFLGAGLIWKGTIPVSPDPVLQAC
jgi:hypothetical protein